MRLLVISPTLRFGGTERYAGTVATHASRRGWDVHLALSQARLGADVTAHLQAAGIAPARLEVGETGDLARSQPIRLLRAARLLRRVRPDAVLLAVPWPERCLGTILACASLRIPTVVVFQLVPRRFTFRRRKILASAWARARRQRWVAVSENNKALLCEAFSIPRDEVTVIYNGAPPPPDGHDIFAPDTPALRADVRRELGLAPDGRILITVGRYVPQKGHQYLLQAAPHLLREFPDVRFVWPGGGPMREVLAAQVRQAGVAEQVLMLGERHDIPRLLRAADLFVLPSLYEGHPFALVEAMAHGLPCIASDASGIPELITHGVDGLLSHSRDSADLLEAIRFALRNPAKASDMGRRGLVRAQSFTEEKMILQTLALLESTALAD